MSIGIDRNLNASISCSTYQTPIQIQPRGMGVDLDANSMLGGGIDHCIHIQVISGTSQQNTARGMSNNINVGIRYRAYHALRLFFAREGEVAVNRGDDE